MSTDDNAPRVIDGVDLTASGAPNWRLVECVNLSGHRSFWLMDPDGGDGAECPGFRFPAHEYPGALPIWIRRRVEDRSVRCGRIAPTTGKPCRRRVNAADEACRFHRDIGESRS
ncbi:hypothetical protein KV112_02655 [Mycolicibacter sp. MYC123]|uniref:Uncharacterized protein n=1 Tax=[Mycobacterium] zoologicum TaxID=2872311 RepID=A0ABU5YF35_9MYCO|nr:MULTISPECIES: hypothetical protein [unclassified Mycolicibacter]MEB3048647.1 hypothetical protein [Mycolicibacter sp. MYC123]MEB3065726.1 hypothetical protein [Mycolicibacter sp. MYC101]